MCLHHSAVNINEKKISNNLWKLICISKYKMCKIQLISKSEDWGVSIATIKMLNYFFSKAFYICLINVCFSAFVLWIFPKWKVSKIAEILCFVAKFKKRFLTESVSCADSHVHGNYIWSRLFSCQGLQPLFLASSSIPLFSYHLWLFSVHLC